MKEYIFDIIVIILLIIHIVLRIINLVEIEDITRRIDHLEEQNNKVHEYILNRIGG